jgi:hypothetical protein
MNIVAFINNRYLGISVIIYLMLLSSVDHNYFAIYSFNLFIVLSYYLFINATIFNSEKWYTQNRLLRLIFIYGLFSVIAYNSISYIYNNNFWVFSEADAIVYHNESIRLATQTPLLGIIEFLKHYSYEDLGMVLVVSTIYRVFESNLLINGLFLILSVFTGLGIFKIGLELMPKRYAFTCAFIFSTSSAFQWYSSSGLKESLMIFFITYGFLQYYRLMKYRRNRHLVLMALSLIPLMLFRPAILFLILGSILIGNLMKQKRTKMNIIIITIFFLGLSITSPYLAAIYDTFLGGGMSSVIYSKQVAGMVIGSVQFTYLVNILAALIGPLPTLIPNTKTVLSFFAPGLIYKTLLSIPFLLGVYYIFKKKISLYYPIAIFTLLQMFSLVLIMEGLELRKSITHFPFIYLIAFGYIGLYSGPNQLNRARVIWFKSFLSVSFLAIILIISVWNFRF